jgi:hypothetical protein
LNYENILEDIPRTKRDSKSKSGSYAIVLLAGGLDSAIYLCWAKTKFSEL